MRRSSSCRGTSGRRADPFCRGSRSPSLESARAVHCCNAVRSAGQNSSIGSAWRDDQTVVGDLAEGAMHWLLRGRGWQALAREVAWAAVAATRQTPDAMEWLVPLVEDQLAVRLEEVRREIRAA